MKTETLYDTHHTLLVADDDPIFLKLLTTFLEKEGFQVLGAQSGREAVDLTMTHQPPLVLLDAHMPDTDGITACRQIKEAFPEADVQVLIITASTDDQLIEAAFDAGASDYINKPINWRLLKHKVHYELKMATNFQALTRSEHRFRVLFEQAPVAYAVLDDHGIIQNGNPALMSLLQTQTIKGLPFTEFLAETCVTTFEQDWRTLLQDGILDDRIYVLRTEPPHHVHFSARLTPSLQTGSREALCILEDITEQVLNTQQLEQLAATDPLTGLLNRRTFDQQFQNNLISCRQANAPLSLILLDIDHFKHINDTFGHPVGDEVLTHLSKTLQTLLHRSTDSAYRLGGEEFAILLPETDEHGAIKVAERIRQHLAEAPAQTSAGTIPFTISAGVATASPGADLTPDKLLKAADEALYRAKRNGRNRTETA